MFEGNQCDAMPMALYQTELASHNVHDQYLVAVHVTIYFVSFRTHKHTSIKASGFAG